MADGNFGCYTYGEARTGGGLLVEFTCRTDEKKEVTAFLSERVRTVREPVTHRVNVQHGGLGMYSRYDITQHRYAGGGNGYIEVLTIAQPPDNRCGILIHEYNGYDGYVFTEWGGVEDAVNAWERHWGSPSDTRDKLPKCAGFIRRVDCGALTPWFYAVGNDELIGDYVFPDGVQDDPVFRFGVRCVVFDGYSIPVIKTCLGTRFLPNHQRFHKVSAQPTRYVYWDDGTVWNEALGGVQPPHPLRDGEEAWIAEAIVHFQALLAGNSDRFTISFLDGSSFTGRWRPATRQIASAEGEYHVTIHLQGARKPQSGIVHFKPTPEAPDLETYVRQRCEADGSVIERFQIDARRATAGGKKWLGAYQARRRTEQPTSAAS